MENIWNIITTIATIIIAYNTFVITRKAFKQEHTIKIHIKAYVDTPSFDSVNIEFRNHGKQTFSIKSYSIGLGTSHDNQNILINRVLDKDIKLYYGDIYKDHINQDDLRTQLKKLNIEQSYNQLLWINVTSSLDHIAFSNVDINPNIIKNKLIYKESERYVATDLFLGLPQMRSYPPTYYYHHKSRR